MRGRPGGDHDPAQLAGQRHGHHVLGHRGAIADPCVVALCDDVEHAVLDHHVQAQLRVGAGELAEHRRNQQHRGIPGYVQAQAANRRLAVQFEGVEAVLDRRKAGTEFFRQYHAGIGRLYGAAGAIQQLDPQARFQVAHGVAQGRGGDAKFIGGMPETAATDDRHEDIQVGQLGAVERSHIKHLLWGLGCTRR